MKPYWTPTHLIALAIACLAVGMISGIFLGASGRPHAFVTTEGSAYYLTGGQGFTVDYWHRGQIIGTIDDVDHAVCRNLDEADSITVKMTSHDADYIIR